jgi:hypothetical protein
VGTSREAAACRLNCKSNTLANGLVDVLPIKSAFKEVRNGNFTLELQRYELVSYIALSEVPMELETGNAVVGNASEVDDDASDVFQ